MEFISLVEDFLHTAQEYGRIIISEVFLPAREKTISPVSVGGIIGGEKFIVGNVLFKFAVDQGVFNGDHASAAKVAGLELQGLDAYYNTRTVGLHFPLMAMIDKKGFRLIASSLLPLGEGSLIYGSNDAAQTIHRDNPRLNSLVEEASAKLNLKPHNCGLDVASAKRMYSCVDLEGHVGSDGRFYLLDFSRAMPPVTPRRVKVNSHLFEMFRPEFVAAYITPLCSDAYSRFCMNMPDFAAHNREVDEATYALLHHCIPDAVPMLRTHFAEHLSAGTLETFSLSSLLHQHGINVRYLGLLLESLVGADFLSRNKSSAVGFLALLDDEASVKRYGLTTPSRIDDCDLRLPDYVALEMVARVVVQEMRAMLRRKMEELRVPVDEPFKGVVVTLLNATFGLSKEALDFWGDTLLPGVLAKFGFDLTLLYHNVPSVRKALFQRRDATLVLWSRIRDIMGLVFSPTVRDLMRLDATVFDVAVIFDVADVVHLGDRVKTLDFISSARAYLAAQEARRFEEAQLWQAAHQAWATAVHHSRDALRDQPNDPVRLALAAQCHLHCARSAGKLVGDVTSASASSIAGRDDAGADGAEGPERKSSGGRRSGAAAASSSVVAPSSSSSSTAVPTSTGTTAAAVAAATSPGGAPPAAGPAAADAAADSASRKRSGSGSAAPVQMHPEMLEAHSLSERSLRAARESPLSASTTFSLRRETVPPKPPPVVALLVRAEVLEEMGHIEESERIFLSVLKRDSGSLECLYKYSCFLRRRGDEESARTLELCHGRALQRQSRCAAPREAVALGQHFAWVNGTLAWSDERWEAVLDCDWLWDREEAARRI